MTRSRKRTPVFGITTAKSEKYDKRKANRRLRTKQKQAARQGNEVLPVLREVSDVWGFRKDGKRYRTKATRKEMRK